MNIYQLLKLPEIQVKFTGASREAKNITIKNSADASNLFRLIIDADLIDWQEQLIMICLSRSHKVIGVRKVGMGGSHSTIIDAKIIFSIALACMADSIILCHNHPGDGLEPSESDKKATEKIRKVGELMDIKLEDHIILNRDNYYSFADNGLIA